MDQKIKILHLEDLPADAELIARELKKGKIDAEINVVTDKQEFIAALVNFSYDIILSDHSLVSFDSHGAIRLIKEAGISVPVILVTATMSDQFAAQVMKEGAYDYILKDRLNRLPSAVANSIKEHVLKNEREAERRSAEVELQKLTKRLQLATKSAGMGIWDWNITTDCLEWDKDMYKLYNIKESQFESAYEGWITRVHPDDMPRVDEDIRLALAGVRKYDTEFRIIWEDGSVHTLRATGIVEKDYSGVPVRLTGTNWDITERKLALQKTIETSEALQQASNDLRKIMTSSIDIICTIDENGRFANVSNASARILGYEPDELISMKYMDLVFAEDIPETAQTATNVMNGEPVTIFENRYTHKNGSLVPMLWSASWDCNDNLMYCIAKDATEKKRLEKAFKTERERINNLFLQSPSCMGVLKGPEHVFETSNQRYLHLINKRDIIGKTIKEVLPEVIGQGYIEILDEVYKTGKSFTANEKLVKLNLEGNGILQDVYIDILYQAYKNNSDEVEGVFFFIVDVTEQVLSRKKIEESESRYRHIVETAQEGIWLIDENSKTTFVNKKMCELLEYSADEMMGRSNVSFKDEEHRKSAIRQLELRKQGMSETHEVNYITKSGKHIWTNNSAAPFFSKEDGSYQGTLSMVTDITARKFAEADRDKLINDLIIKNKDLEQFAYIISHNLRAPVANIIGASNALNNLDLTDDEKEMLGNGINESVARLDEVIVDLNNILQVKIGFKEKKEEVIFSHIVDNVKGSIQSLLDDIEIICDFSEVDEFMSLKAYFHSIFYNLISNSIKYRRHDIHTVIQIKSHLYKNKLELIFRDNGTGIDLAKKGNQVFGLYNRFHANTEGKGVGLFMVKTQVETLGGKISIQSKVNEGTEFIIQLEV